MALIHYDVTISPDNPEVQFSISATTTSFTVQVEHMGDFSIKVDPSAGTIVAGVVAGAIVGAFGGPAGILLGGGAGVGAVYAVGALIKSGLESGLKDGINGQKETIDFGQALGYSINVAGVQVDLTLAALNLSTYDGMLMATGQVQVS